MYDYYSDGRNPYGSRGGYVRDSRGRSDYNYYDMRENDYGYDHARRRDMDMMRDGHSSRMLSDDQIRRWSDRMMEEIDDRFKPKFKMDAVISKAEEMGIRFDKFSPNELYAAILMAFTDDFEAIGTPNVDVYIKLGKAWLCDKDSSLKYGEKLAAYYNNVVNVF